MKNVAMFAAVVACAAGSVSAIVIDFDDLATGTAISNQYSEAVFSTVASHFNVALGFAGISLPNILCTQVNGGAVDCLQPVFVDFTNPVNNLSFLAVEPNQFGTVAEVNIFSSNVYVGTVPITGLGPAPGRFGSGSVIVDLSAFTNVTRIEIVAPAGFPTIDNSEGGNGVGYDLFTFDVVPAPSSIALLGVGALFAGRRRRA